MASILLYPMVYAVCYLYEPHFRVIGLFPQLMIACSGTLAIALCMGFLSVVGNLVTNNDFNLNPVALFSPCYIVFGTASVLGYSFHNIGFEKVLGILCSLSVILYSPFLAYFLFHRIIIGRAETKHPQADTSHEAERADK